MAFKTTWTSTSLVQPRISVIGSGAFGTALAKILIDAQQENLIIYGVVPSELSDLANGINTKYFGNAPLPRFAVTSDLVAALRGADVIVLAVPSHALGRVFEAVKALLTKPALIVSAAKGFFLDLSISAHEGLVLAARETPLVRGVVSLIGPSFAEEMVAGRPTAVLAVSAERALSEQVKALFTNDYFQLEVHDDVSGVLACAIFKNILALGAGIIDVSVSARNTAAAFLTRGLGEMQAFVRLQGGSDSAVLSLAGVGDLLLTATSDLSRNFRAGQQIARAGVARLDPAITVEGISALRRVYALSVTHQLNLPIIKLLHQIIVEQTLAPSALVTSLWAATAEA